MTTFLDAHDSDEIGRQLNQVRAWWNTVRQPVTIGLVYGGISAEDQLYIAKCPREQLSLTALSESLEALGADFVVLDPCDAGFVPQVTGCDVVLSNLHGPFGEDGRLQGLLDYLRLPYAGSGVAACAIAADKDRCKTVMVHLGLPTPRWDTWAPPARPTWPGHPVMIKPASGGSSVGMTLARHEHEFHAALHQALDGDSTNVVIEEYVPGLPVTVGLLELPGGVATLPPLAAEVQQADFYDADTKLAGAGAVTFSLANLPPSLLDELAAHARTLWDGLGCRGTARIDFIVTPDSPPQMLEVNTTPGMSRGSNFATAAALSGISHTDLVQAILHEALTRPPYAGPLPKPAIPSPDHHAPHPAG